MRILVSAASRHYATFEVAQAIAKTLERAGIKVDVRRPEEVGHLAAYDGVVLGSAIYAGHWMKSAKDLVERTSSRMHGIPVWLFSTGPIGDPLKPEGLPVDVTPMLKQSGAREHRIFGGRLDMGDLGFGEKAIVRLVGAAEGDYRPWAEIDAWAEEIATTLKAAEPADGPRNPPSSGEGLTSLGRRRADHVAGIGRLEAAKLGQDLAPEELERGRFVREAPASQSRRATSASRV